MKKQTELFHELDDVYIPSTCEIGYVFAISGDVNEALVVTHDGADRQWVPFEQLTHLERAS